MNKSSAGQVILRVRFVEEKALDLAVVLSMAVKMSVFGADCL